MSGFWKRTGLTVSLWLLGLVSLALGSGYARAEERLALVIGNGAYAGDARLENPVRDARAMADVLRDAKFRVTSVEDASGAALNRAIEQFGRSAEAVGPDAVVLVYYAGHAAQFDGLNYLLPVDVPTDSEERLRSASVGVEAILKRLDATGARTRFVILDACRNNPFLAADAGPRGLTVDGPLAQVRGENGLTRLDAGIGTLVAFATAPGRVAADGVDGHSPYTAALLSTIREPGLPVEALFRRARLAVHAATAGEQVPWESSSLTGAFSFFPGAAPAEVADPLPPASRAVIAAGPTRARLRGLGADEAHKLVVYLGTPEVMRLYVEVFPADARALPLYALIDGAAQETAWVWAVRERTASALLAFRALYPASLHDGEITRLLRNLPANRPVLAALCAPSRPISPIVPLNGPAPRKVERERRAMPAVTPAPLPKAPAAVAAAGIAARSAARVPRLPNAVEEAPPASRLPPRPRPAVQVVPVPQREAPQPVRRPVADGIGQVVRIPERARREPVVVRPRDPRPPIREVARPPRPTGRLVDVHRDDGIDIAPARPMLIPGPGFVRPRGGISDHGSGRSVEGRRPPLGFGGQRGGRMGFNPMGRMF